jgi:diphthamide biosynthesis protein 4
LEIFDLDDMEVETTRQQGHGIETAETTVWYRGCRCGDEKGFLVREEDLEREAERGEVMVGCRGCSLWAKVMFAVDESEAEVEANG